MKDERHKSSSSDQSSQNTPDVVIVDTFDTMLPDATKAVV